MRLTHFSVSDVKFGTFYDCNSFWLIYLKNPKKGSTSRVSLSSINIGSYCILHAKKSLDKQKSIRRFKIGIKFKTKTETDLTTIQSHRYKASIMFKNSGMKSYIKLGTPEKSMKMLVISWKSTCRLSIVDWRKSWQSYECSLYSARARFSL